MSWDVDLHDDRGHLEGQWNYTHNVNLMIAEALRVQADIITEEHWLVGHTWWHWLNGLSGPDGRDYIATIITGLEADPDKYRAMNPANGWGDYDQLLGVLREMRDQVPDWPCTWSASG